MIHNHGFYSDSILHCFGLTIYPIIIGQNLGDILNNSAEIKGVHPHCQTLARAPVIKE